VEKQKTKIEVEFHFQCSKKKWKTKIEFRIPFSDGVGKQNETGSSNFVFLCCRKTVGTKEQAWIALTIHDMGFTKPYQIVNSEKYETFCVSNFPIWR